MPLRHPRRLLLTVLGATAAIGIGVAVPATAAPTLPVGLPALTEDAAAGLLPAVTEAGGGALAGTWFEDGKLMAGTWDPALAPVLSGLGATPVVRDEPRRDPAAVLGELAARTADAMPEGLAAYGVDPRTEQVVLEMVDGPGADTLAGELTSGMDPAAYRVERVPAAPHRQAVSGGDTIRDGAQRCTAGFVASDSAGDWLLTAGHCTRGGSATWYDEAQNPIGSTSRTAGGGIDVGMIAVESGTASPTVAGTPVAGSSAAPVGASVCFYGSTSGRSCGPVERTDVTVNFEGQQQSGLTSVATCAQEGDSGAPYITSGGQAQGVHTGAGGPDNCTSYFTPIATATDALGVTLSTG